MAEISFRTIGHPPQNVYADGHKVGRVEFIGGGWNAFDLGGNLVGFDEHKSAAGRILAARAAGASDQVMDAISAKYKEVTT